MGVQARHLAFQLFEQDTGALCVAGVARRFQPATGFFHQGGAKHGARAADAMCVVRHFRQAMSPFSGAGAGSRCSGSRSCPTTGNGTHRPTFRLSSARFTGFTT